MKVVVTGAAGFVGSRLSRRLLEEGHDVRGIDSVTNYYDPSIKERNLEPLLAHPRFELSRSDLNVADLDDLLHGAELIYHEAGQPGVRASWGEDFRIYTDMNVLATQRLLEHAKSITTLRRFVYASSSSVYGNAERYPTREDDRPQPLSPYGVTKLAAEHLCSLYAANYGVPTTSLRYFTVYGPGQRPDMAFTRFCRAAVTGDVITVYGDGLQQRDFTFIDDVVEANVLAGTSNTEPGLVVNVAGGSNVTVNDVLSKIETLSGAELNVERRAAVKGDVRRTGGSTDRIREALGWAPKVSLDDGLAAQLRWAQETFQG